MQYCGKSRQSPQTRCLPPGKKMDWPLNWKEWNHLFPSCYHRQRKSKNHPRKQRWYFIHKPQSPSKFFIFSNPHISIHFPQIHHRPNSLTEKGNTQHPSLLLGSTLSSLLVLIFLSTKHSYMRSSTNFNSLTLSLYHEIPASPKANLQQQQTGGKRVYVQRKFV